MPDSPHSEVREGLLVTEAASDLLERQNSPRMLFVLRAMAASHVRAQRLEGLRLGISVLIAVLGLVTTMVDSLAVAVTAVGALWALLHSVGLSAWAEREVERAALLQEMFDTDLYRIPWNRALAGESISPDEVSKLSRSYRGSDSELLDYYEIPRLPHPYDVLACQEQNLAWGARVRQRYAFAILVVVTMWSAAGLMVGALLQITVTDIVLQFYIPSLGALMMGLEIYRAQQATAQTRGRLLALVQERINGAVGRPEAEVDLIVLARQVQDVIFQTRVTYTRVPNIFFDRYRARDRIDFRETMTELSRIVNGS